MNPGLPPAVVDRAHPASRAGSRIALCAWGLATAYGFHLALQYQAASGAPVVAHAAWPAELSVGLDPERATLLVTLHPHCPCSRATLSELERLLARWSDSLRTHVLFYADPERSDWHETDLWRRAASIPGVRVHADVLGASASRLGAWVSGTVFLYSTEGVLLFDGGITAGRGHEGENQGARALAAILASRTPETRSTLAYGCELMSAGPSALAGPGTPRP